MHCSLIYGIFGKTWWLTKQGPEVDFNFLPMTKCLLNEGSFVFSIFYHMYFTCSTLFTTDDALLRVF